MPKTANICKTCRSYLNRKQDKENEPSEAEMNKVCSVCLDLWNDDDGDDGRLKDAFEKACAPYGGLKRNRFASSPNQAPTLSISGEVNLRYRWFSAQQPTVAASSFSAYWHDLKQHVHEKMRRILEAASVNDDKDVQAAMDVGCENEEEQGYLSMNILCLPPKEMEPSYLGRAHARGKKRKRQRHHHHQTQGGYPGTNMENRLQEQDGYTWMTLSEAEILAPSEPDNDKDNKPMEYHIAIYRRPIFLYGYYTKSRRDVSQTPFIIEGKALGRTSVEEQVCQPVIDMLGISTENNHYDATSSHAKVQYGMCKFHASGREDMDVRMLLRPGESSSKGRPFCIQLIDALRPISSKDQLQQLVDTINGGTAESNSHWYGKNESGVGISDDFGMVPAQAFSGLQADTETKVKHYGCHCWSEQKLPESWTLPSTMSFPLTIDQKTPLRVLHRRVNAIRQRQILGADAIRVDDHHFRLTLSTQAGTYVKEFVHGDLRRTIPSMCTLLEYKCNLLLLDCEGIDIDPPIKFL